ncbi:fungal-specific transcription factor domain-containing protein [Lipomyces chichibuensis]|uniref:fungal-specific transcription factor domain-containing protein n=1 Tax=Lipomyces chichibuensis TaxID=1546026 RepID=UPI0033431B95
MAPTPPPVSSSVLPRSASSTPSLSVSSTASTDSQSVPISPSTSLALSNSATSSSSAAPTITNVPTFSTGRFQSASPLSVSRSLSADVNDQIHVFRVSSTQGQHKSGTSERNFHDAHSQQQKGARAAAARRTTQACERCHKRRTKCDGKYPECMACVKASVRCQYVNNRSGAVLYPHGYVTALEERVSWLERTIHDQFPELNITEAPTGSKVNLSSSQSKPSMPAARTSQRYRVGPEHYYYEAFRNPAETLDELAVHVGFLSLGSAAEQSVAADAPAEPRFIGSSSGLAVASNVNRIIKAMGIQRPLTTTTAEIRLSYTKSPAKDGVKADGEENKYDPLVPPLTPGLADEFWPPYEEAVMLARAGFEEIVFYPILNSCTFMVYLRHSYEPETMQVLRGIPGWRSMFFLMCAIGSAAMGLRDKQRGYFALATRCAQKALMKDNLRALRVLLLLALYSFYDPEGASAWLAVGTALRIAIALGFHRQSSAENLNLINQEIRKRVFWAIYSLDRILSAILGRPITLHDRDIDVGHYLDLGNDPEMTGDMSSGNPFHTDVSIALHMVKLRQLATRILLSVHHTAQWGCPRPDESLLEELHRSLDNWKSNLPRITIAPERTRMRVEIEYHEHLMLLYRPSPLFSVPSTSAAAICANSASTAIELYAALYSSLTNPPTFIACRGVFTAALTLLWAHFSCKEYGLQLLSARTIRTSLETAERCLTAGSRSWAFAERCAEVLVRFIPVLDQSERMSMQMSISGGSKVPDGDAVTPTVGDVQDLLDDVPFDISGFSYLLSGRGLMACADPQPVHVEQPPPLAETEVLGQAQYVYPIYTPQPLEQSGQEQYTISDIMHIPGDLQLPVQDIDVTAARREFEIYNSKLMSEVFGSSSIAHNAMNANADGFGGAGMQGDGQVQGHGQGTIFQFEDFMDLV